MAMVMAVAITMAMVLIRADTAMARGIYWQTHKLNLNVFCDLASVEQGSQNHK